MPVHSDIDIRAAISRSVELIARHQRASGAYPACEEFSAYRGYSWFRDGAFTADGMSRQGQVESASGFHDWCDGVLASLASKVAALVEQSRAGRPPAQAEMLPTRFAFNGRAGADPWWDFQLDGYGIWLWAVHEHAARHSLPLSRWQDGIRIACDYIAEFWNTPCYDWWEEHAEQRHNSTLGALHAGLTACASSDVLDPATRELAARKAADVRKVVLTEGVVSGGCLPATGRIDDDVDGCLLTIGNTDDGSQASAVPGGYLSKWIGSEAVDASTAACVVPFGVVAPGDDRAEATLARIERDLCFDGGTHRFAADVFYGGGQWPLLTCLLGWNHARAGRRDRALELLRWAVAQADADGLLPEQVDSHLLHPEHRAEWIAKWGPVAKPLLWSHGMVLTLAAELGITVK
jgi:GH15 family glucan-1,4-alpha-glucosidase